MATQLELFIRLHEVRARVGLSKSQIYKLIDLDQFPKQIKLGRKMSLWSALEIEEWAKEKIKQRDEELEKENNDDEEVVAVEIVDKDSGIVSLNHLEQALLTDHEVDQINGKHDAADRDEVESGLQE